MPAFDAAFWTAPATGQPAVSTTVSTRRARRPRHSGFSLIELMIVVVIFSVTAALSAYSMNGDNHRQRANDLARAIQFALLEARTGSVSDGFQRQLACKASGCTALIAAKPGMSAPSAWVPTGDRIQAVNTAVVWALTPTTDVAPTTPPAGPLGGTGLITFLPDGRATSATVYVNDLGGTSRYKIYVYPATGMARMVEGW